MELPELVIHLVTGVLSIAVFFLMIKNIPSCLWVCGGVQGVQRCRAAVLCPQVWCFTVSTVIKQIITIYIL